MPTKIRLQRKGKKGRPFYHIVVADSRAPRDGKYIEKIGVYNTLTAPATIDLAFDKAVKWLQDGAQPTDTCKAILSYKGAMYKFHLLNGVKKGAMTLEQAENKFKVWLKEKEEKIAAASKKNLTTAQTEAKKRAEAEAKVKEAKAHLLAEKKSKLAQEAAKATTPAEVEEKVEEAPAAAEETETPQAEA